MHLSRAVMSEYVNRREPVRERGVTADAARSKMGSIMECVLRDLCQVYGPSGWTCDQPVRFQEAAVVSSLLLMCSLVHEAG